MAAAILLILDNQTADVTGRSNSPPLDPSADRIIRELFFSCIDSKPREHMIVSKGFAKDVNSLSVEVIRKR